MGSRNNFNWAGASAEEQLRRVRAAPPERLDAVMRDYDWAQHPETVLGWVSAQQGIGLSAALSGFFNGDPWRFNYLPKRDVGAEYTAVTSLLDTICRRINAGFYLPDLAPLCDADMAKLDAWISNQRADQREKRCGRWVIEAEVLDPLFARKREAMEEALREEIARAGMPRGGEEAAGGAGFSLKRLVGPLAG